MMEFHVTCIYTNGISFMNWMTRLIEFYEVRMGMVGQWVDGWDPCTILPQAAVSDPSCPFRKLAGWTALYLIAYSFRILDRSLGHNLLIH